MKKNVLLYLALLCLPILAFSQGSFAPAVGYTGTTAIYKDSSVIKGWATGIEVKRGWLNISDKTFQSSGTSLASYGTPGVALLKADNSVVSLGDSGVATLTFDRPVINGSGPDFTVFENGFFSSAPNAFLELAFTEVSSDGIHFVRFPAVSEVSAATQIASFGYMDASYIHNFAGKYTADYGTPFDLEDVKDSANLDVMNIRFVRLVDAIGNVNTQYSVSIDSKGNIVNDPFPTPFASSGFDLDAVGVINSGTPYLTSTFNDLTLESDTFYNPGASGSFQSGNVSFPYNHSTFSWDGFAYANKQDNITGTYDNQYSPITGGGIEGAGTNYGISYVTSDWTTYKPIPNVLTFSDGMPHVVSGFYTTNSTYAYYTMKNGSAYSKIFGGASGSEADYFKLYVWGEKEDGSETDSVEFYLADFRFAADSLDYFVTDWRWIDLNSIGAVKKVKFSLESSDAGAYGINTPTYFCMDNFTVVPNSSTTGVKPTENVVADVKIYPNPFVSALTVECTETSNISMFDMFGHKILNQTATAGTVQLSTGNLAKGYYLIKVENKKGSVTQKIVKQ